MNVMLQAQRRLGYTMDVGLEEVKVFHLFRNLFHFFYCGD